MFKFNRLVCATVIGVCAAVAFGAAVKIRSFDTASFGREAPDADGMAILNYASGQDETVVQIILSDFTTDTPYEVELVSPLHTLTPQATLFTDKHGHGTLHLTVIAPPGENGNWTDSDIRIGFNLSSTTNPEELHAVGCNPASVNCP